MFANQLTIDVKSGSAGGFVVYAAEVLPFIPRNNTSTYIHDSYSAGTPEQPSKIASAFDFGMNEPCRIGRSGIEYRMVSACVLAFYPGGKCYTGGRNMLRRNTGPIQIKVTAASKFGCSVAYAVRICRYVTVYNTIVAVPGLIGNDIADFVK